MSEEEKLQLENECLLKYSKAQMIQKYIDELEENCTLSDLWCKSQEENKELKNKIEVYKNANEYHQNIIHELETMKPPNQLYGENVRLRNQLQQKEKIIKEVREWAKKYSCQFTNDDGELVVSEISFNIQARPCDLFKILDKEKV